jgi:hypothetical protein
MDVEIDLRDASPAARLVHADDLKRFAVVLIGDAAPPADRLGPAGVARCDEYAWVSISELVRLAGDAATPEWRASFEAMIEYARSKGWVDDELGAVRGHVERR